MDLQTLFSPDTIAVLSVALTDLARRSGVPSKYLPYVSTLMGGVSGFVLSLPSESVTEIEGMLTGGVTGIVATLLYGVAKKLLKK